MQQSYRIFHVPGFDNNQCFISYLPSWALRFHILLTTLNESRLHDQVVARKNFTTQPLQNRSWTSRLIRTLPAILLKLLGFKPTQKAIQFFPVSCLTVTYRVLIHLLRSSPITEPSILLQDDWGWYKIDTVNPWRYGGRFSAGNVQEPVRVKKQ